MAPRSASAVAAASPATPPPITKALAKADTRQESEKPQLAQRDAAARRRKACLFAFRQNLGIDRAHKPGRGEAALGPGCQQFLRGVVMQMRQRRHLAADG